MFIYNFIQPHSPIIPQRTLQVFLYKLKAMLVLWPLQGKVLLCSQFPPPSAENEQTQSSFLHRDHTDIPRKGKKHIRTWRKETEVQIFIVKYVSSEKDFEEKDVAMEIRVLSEGCRFYWMIFDPRVSLHTLLIDVCRGKPSNLNEKHGNNGNLYYLYCNIWSLISNHLLALLPCRWPLLSTSLGLHQSCCRSWRYPLLAGTALACLEQQSCIAPQLCWLPWVWILFKASNIPRLVHVNWWRAPLNA